MIQFKRLEANYNYIVNKYNINSISPQQNGVGGGMDMYVPILESVQTNSGHSSQVIIKAIIRLIIS